MFSFPSPPNIHSSSFPNHLLLFLSQLPLLICSSYNLSPVHIQSHPFLFILSFNSSVSLSQFSLPSHPSILFCSIFLFCPSSHLTILFPSILGAHLVIIRLLFISIF
jgi:hypothetical protein